MLHNQIFLTVYHFRSNNLNCNTAKTWGCFPNLAWLFPLQFKAVHFKAVHMCHVLQCHNVVDLRWYTVGNIRLGSASLKLEQEQVWKYKFRNSSLEKQRECRNGVRSLGNTVLWKIVAEMFIPQTIFRSSIEDGRYRWMHGMVLAWVSSVHSTSECIICAVAQSPSALLSLQLPFPTSDPFGWGYNLASLQNLYYKVHKYCLGYH